LSKSFSQKENGVIGTQTRVPLRPIDGYTSLLRETDNSPHLDEDNRQRPRDFDQAIHLQVRARSSLDFDAMAVVATTFRVRIASRAVAV